MGAASSTDSDHNASRWIMVARWLVQPVIEFENDVAPWKVAPEHLFAKQKVPSLFLALASLGT